MGIETGARIYGAKVRGIGVGSMEVEVDATGCSPAAGQDVSVDIGTAGATALIMQLVVPTLLFVGSDETRMLFPAGMSASGKQPEMAPSRFITGTAGTGSALPIGKADLDMKWTAAGGGGGEGRNLAPHDVTQMAGLASASDGSGSRSRSGLVAPVAGAEPDSGALGLPLPSASASASATSKAHADMAV